MINMNDMLSKAIELAARAHDGQTGRSGQPYILHPLRVMINCEGETAKICAALHDVVENSDITFDDLRAEGFNEEILTVIDCLTRRDGESYDDYIGRILVNWRVKSSCKFQQIRVAKRPKMRYPYFG